MPFSIRLEGHHAPFEAAVRRKLLWLSRDDDNRLNMNRFHEGLGANPRRSWLNSRNGKIRLSKSSREPGRKFDVLRFCSKPTPTVQIGLTSASPRPTRVGREPLKDGAND